MEKYLKLYIRHWLKLMPLIILLVYLFPLIIWYRLTEYSSRTVSEFLGYLGTRGALIYAAVVTAAVIADFAVKYRAFSKQLSEFKGGNEVRYELKLPGHRLYLTDEGIISTYGSAARYAGIDRVLIERTETEWLPVYHMYVFPHEGKRFTVPIGLRTLPEDFDETLLKYNTEVIRQNRPLLGRGGKVREK